TRTSPTGVVNTTHPTSHISHSLTSVTVATLAPEHRSASVTPLARWYRRARITARVTVLAVITLLTGLAGELPPALALSGSPGPPPGPTPSGPPQPPPGPDDSNVRYEPGGLRLDPRPAGPASIRSGNPEGMLLTAAHPLAEFSSQVLA